MGIITSSVGRLSHHIKVADRKPFLPICSIEDLYNASTKSTGNPLLDAVSEAIVSHQFTTAKEVAEYLDLSQDALNATVKIFTGSTLGEVVSFFVVCRIKAYLESHPDDSLDQVARATGFRSKSSINCIYKKYNLGTPRQDTSHK